jgi:hypothetical protein
MRGVLRTDWTPFCVFPSDAFSSMELHIDLLPRSQFREHDIRVSRRRGVVCEYVDLLASRYPFQMRGTDLVVDVELVRVYCVLGSFFVSRADVLETEDDRVPVRCGTFRACRFD